MTTSPRTRKVALCCLAAVLFVTAACSSTDTTAGPVGDPVAAEAPSWLFTLTSTAGTFSTNTDGVSTLSLTGIDDHFTAFTDRPDRDASIISNEQFVQEWPSMFEASDPNAVLVEHEPSGKSDSFVLTLSEPKLDAGTLTFTAEIVDAEDHSDQIAGLTASPHSEPPASFTIVSLFIDDVTGSSTPTGNCSTKPAMWAPLANMNGCDLSYKDLSGAYLSGVNLQNANLTGANLLEANLSGANLSGANLTRAYLHRSILEFANLTGANLTGASLTSASVSLANLTDANLQFANLQDANLTGSDLTNTNLHGAYLKGANLTGSDLTGVTWKNTTCPGGQYVQSPCPSR